MTKKRGAAKPRKSAPQNRGRTGAKPPEGKRFEEGKSGNPGGRPSTKWIRDYLSVIHDKRTGMTRRLAYWHALFRAGLNPKHREQVKALALIAAYDVGKPVQAVELTGKEGGPIETESTVATMTSEEKRRRLNELMAKASARLPVAEEEPGDAADPGSDDADLDDE